MRKLNTLPAVVIVTVAVLAVAAGGVLAAQRSPRSEGGSAAAPLVPPATTPLASPATVSSSTPPALPNGKITLKLSKLDKGRPPQLPYLVGREVRGGAGDPVKIPGAEPIHHIARLGNSVLAVLGTNKGSDLLRLDNTGEKRRTPDVSSLVLTADAASAVYAAPRIADTGEDIGGGIVYAEQADGPVRKIAVGGFGLEVIAYRAGTVYFRSAKIETGKTWQLYAWTPGSPTATLVKTVPSPTALSSDATIAASLDITADTSSCSAVVEVATGKKLWRTCENGLEGFTPDGRTVIGGPTYGDGYGAAATSALDARTGKLLYEWNGLAFLETVAEDDQHLLIRADDGEGTKGAIIRCDVSTGRCELATPLALTQVSIGQ
ncbi:hypothetical protein [Kribbella sp. NPDC023855]|uniref:hypothetical protein n=1 Tax=Kribbella sp. NPDC023855 TaxID=3154698 RepID=UPI0033F28B63